MSFLDLGERLLELPRPSSWSTARWSMPRSFPPGSTSPWSKGAVANVDNLELLRQIRERSRIVVSLGDCAVTGNVTSLRNYFTVERPADRRLPRRARECSARGRGGPGTAGPAAAGPAAAPGGGGGRLPPRLSAGSGADLDGAVRPAAGGSGAVERGPAHLRLAAGCSAILEASWRRRSPSPRSPASKGTPGSPSTWMMPARWPMPAFTSPNSAASRSSVSAAATGRCRRSPSGSAASARSVTPWPRPRPGMPSRG